MELTPEERQRIYEEEKARLEAREKLRPPKTSVAAWVVLCIFVLFVITLVIGFLAEQPHTTSTPSPSSSTSGVRTLRGRYWCAESLDDAGQIGIAVTRGDTAAIAGMLARGKAFEVEKGTRVMSGGEIDMGISLTHVLSGYQVGRECYIPTRALE
jgi:hypothetical protein